jgi:hypothetical protein
VRSDTIAATALAELLIVGQNSLNARLPAPAPEKECRLCFATGATVEYPVCLGLSGAELLLFRNAGAAMAAALVTFANGGDHGGSDERSESELPH